MAVKGKTWIWHILFWCGYIVLEYLANIYHIRGGSEREFAKSILLNLPFIVLPAYFVAYIVVPRFIKRRNVMASVFSFLGIGAFVFYGRVFWFIQMSHFDWAMFADPPMGKILKNVIRDYSVIAFATCVYLLADWRARQKLTEDLMRAKAEAELQLLKGQLQPHFLFNTLNNIYSLALVKSDLTASYILKLTELLDYLVYKAGKDKVSVNREIALIENYIQLESLRQGKKMQLTADFAKLEDTVQIAPLILLPFVENCFKHGGPDENGDLIVDMRLRNENNQLIFEVENSIGNSTESETGSGGVGLDNIRRRLDLLYPQRFTLTIIRKDQRFKVYLRIELDE